MIWRVTIRGEDGNRKSIDLNASSRQELFALLKEKGIVAISVDAINEDSNELANKRLTAKIIKILIAVVACASIFVSAYLVYNYFNKPSKAPISSNQTPQVKRATSPLVPRKKALETKIDAVQETTITNQIETYRDERGILRYKGGLRVVHRDKKKAEPVRPANQYKSKTSIFKNRAEHEIARLLTMRPGQSMIGTRRYDSRFEADYAKSLFTPIIVKDDDPPDVAAMKRAMIDAKIEISDRMRQGEKLSDILEETRLELMRLSRVKRDIEKLVRDETRNQNITEAEVADYITAANKLLEKEGIAPINGSSIIRSNILLKMKGSSK